VQLVECVPNFSEGRDSAVIAALEQAAGEWLIHSTSDPDHHRTVLTLAGPPDRILEASLRLARTAIDRIDLTRHTGVHPRIGALDVLPFVPLEELRIDDCAVLASRAGHGIAAMGVPVHFYEYAAIHEKRRNLAEIRLRRPAPDLGGEPHPTAGSTAVGARKILIAYNVYLESDDLEAARRIARAVRASSGGLPEVKALGLFIESRRQTQVSMNLIDYEITPPHVAFLAVREEAARLRIKLESSELIGLIPQKALDMARGVDLQWENLTPESVLETQLARIRESARFD
jgi:glutamate formiminotransferase/glutamate formiminotransferase/formiminotetrahydrofolate cyclodeaminase